MDYPFGHHNHHHHGRDEDNSGDYPRPPYPPPPFASGFPPPQSYPPPPSYGGPFESFPHPPPPPQAFPPSPPQVTRIHHSSHTPHLESPNYPPPTSQASYSPEYGSHHTPSMESPNYPSYGHQTSFESETHESGGGGGFHRFRPHVPSFIEGHFHHSSSDASSHHDGGYDNTNEGGALYLEGYFANKPTFKIYSKAGGDTYCVAIRDGKVILAHSDPNDLSQHWYKDEKYSTKVKDEDGYPSFALVNKATGQALKHSVSAHPVQLVPYKHDVLDSSILWTESKDLGSGFRTIRMVNNVHLVLDAFNGDKDHGGVHEGTVIALYKPWKGDNQNQQWKLYPHSHA